MAAVTLSRDIKWMMPLVLTGLSWAFDANSAESRAEAESAQGQAMETVALTVDGINATSGEDNPGVVYILPWQPPTLPRRTRDALETNASELLAPMDPTVFERHQNFQQSLNPTLDSTNTRR